MSGRVGGLLPLRTTMVVLQLTAPCKLVNRFYTGYAVDRNGEKKMESGSVARSLTRRFHLIKPTFQVLYVQDGWAKGKLFLRYTS